MQKVEDTHTKTERIKFLELENAIDGHNLNEFIKMDKSHLRSKKAYIKEVDKYRRATKRNIEQIQKGKI